MSLLLDTHALIWIYQNSERLSSNVRSILETQDDQLFISMASLWEMAIKTGLGKLEIGVEFEKFVHEITDNGIQILPIETTHIICYASLPFHHGDPFDRMIAAQVLVEKINLVSVDQIFEKYFENTSVKRVW